MLLRLLKQAFTKPARPPAAPAASKTPPPAPAGQKEDRELRELLDHCAGLATGEVNAGSRRVVESYAAQFPAPLSSSGPNVFVYHVDMGKVVLEFRDMKVDTSRFNYISVLRAFVDSVTLWHPDSNIYLVTNPGSTLDALAGGRVHLVKLDVAAEFTMYERVRAMCAYVHSQAFHADTLFLDSDAFLNGPATACLEGEFDIAVTFRNQPRFMPVNEGVMMASVRRPQAVRSFFDRYLATYDVLTQDDRVKAFYGDVRQWRGGQLSLNAVTRGGYPFDAYRDIQLDGVAVRALPTDPFNFSHEYGESLDPRDLAAKFIVHFKGLRKESLDAWTAYARGIRQRPVHRSVT